MLDLVRVCPPLGRKIRHLPPASLVPDAAEHKPVASLQGRRKILGAHRLERLAFMKPIRIIIGKGFRISLYNPGKSTKLALLAVPIPVVIRVFGYKLSFRDLINDLDFRDGLHREGKRRLPAGDRVAVVFEIIFSRRAVGDAGHGPHMVIHVGSTKCRGNPSPSGRSDAPRLARIRLDTASFKPLIELLKSYSPMCPENRSNLTWVCAQPRLYRCLRVPELVRIVPARGCVGAARGLRAPKGGQNLRKFSEIRND